MWRAPVNEPLHPSSWERSGGSTDYRVTSPYAMRSDGFHAALDIGNGRLGGPIYATRAGRVLAVGNLGWPWSQPTTLFASGNYGGLMVIIEHAPSGIAQAGEVELSLYAHLASASVRPGQLVGEHELIGVLGESGSAIRQGHLHFSIGRGTRSGARAWVDPWPLVRGDDMRMPVGFRRGPDNRKVTIQGRADRAVNLRERANGRILSAVRSSVPMVLIGHIDATEGTAGRWWVGVLHIGTASTPPAEGVAPGPYVVAVHGSLCSEPVPVERFEVPDPELVRAARAAVNVLNGALG